MESFFSFVSPEVYSWVILPILIIVARMMDVSLGTLRVIFIMKDYKYIAPILGFFEVLIWLLVITRVVKEINNPICYIAYPLGFSIGNYLGLAIERHLYLGNVLVRIVTSKEADKLIKELKELAYSFTSLDAVGNCDTAVKVILSVLDRKDLKGYLSIVEKNNPKAFYTIEEVKSVAKNSDYKKFIRSSTKKY